MTVKRKDFQKTAAYLQEFLLKLNEDAECAELRDALNLALLHMQKYYRVLQNKLHENVNKNGNPTLRSSVRGLSPMTPFRDAPDKFQWKWIDLENPRVSMSMTVDASISLGNLPMIFHAVKSGDLELIQELVKKDDNVVNKVDAIGRTPLMYGIHYEQYESVRLLINSGADCNACAHDGSTGLHRACHDGLFQMVDLLLQCSGDLHIQDQFGRAPIHWAVVTPQTECLQLLINYNANVNVRDQDGASPCMWACRMDNIKHFEFLSRVENQEIDEADGIERDNNGRTWMHWAVRRTDPLECLRTLLTEETAPIKDDDGKTVMLLAAEFGSLPSCKLILEIAGKECINDRDDQDRTPLHLCVIGGHGEVANFLLDKGADLDARDKFNASPLDYARGRQLHYCLLILASHMRQRAREGRTPDSEKGSVANGLYTREQSILSDANGITKPITPPHPPKAPPPTTPRNFKRPVVRSSSLSRSESFERSGLRNAMANRRAKSLDVRDYEELKASGGNLGVDYEGLKNAPGGSDYKMDNDEQVYDDVMEPSQWERDERLPNGDVPMSVDEDRQEVQRHEPAPLKQNRLQPAKHLEVHNNDIDEGVSIGEMDVSDLDGEDSDQATVIHRPHAKVSAPQQEMMKFHPHPPPSSPNLQHPLSPNVVKHQEPTSPTAAAPKYIERADEENPVQAARKPVPAPRGPFQGRIPPPRHSQSLANQAQNQMRPIPKQDLRQKSPPQHKLRPPVNPLAHGGMVDQRMPPSHDLSQRSSSQASSQDLTPHEFHDEVTDLLKHPAQAPLTPPEVKRKPPLPPQLMPLSQPRMPGSHIQLPPAAKGNKRKKKKKKDSHSSEVSQDLPPATKGYTAPLQPPPYGNLQPQIRSANLYSRRSQEQGRYSQEETLQYDDHYNNANRPPGPVPPYSHQEPKQPRTQAPHFHQPPRRSGLYNVESEENLSTIDAGYENNGPLYPDEGGKFSQFGNQGFKGRAPSRSSGQNSPKEKPSGFLSPKQSHQPRAKTAKYESPEEPPLVEGRRVNYSKHHQSPPAHLSQIPPQHTSQSNFQFPGKQSG